jgi:hypothetical protein
LLNCGFYISGVIVASMRFSNNGCRHPRVPKPHREGKFIVVARMTCLQLLIPVSRHQCRNTTENTDVDNCDMCKGPAGLMVQGEAFFFRCSKCDALGPGSLLEFVADRLQSTYRAVLLSRESKELSVVAEGVGTEIVPLVLAATAGG